MAGKKRNKIRITFNAPVTLCFALVCALVLAVDYLTKGRAVQTVFSSGGGKACGVPFDFSSLFSYLRLFLHVFGSLNFTQFVSNFAFILLLGPMLEEKYGSPVLALMMAVTALVSGVVNACFGQGVLSGAGDIAFMMVLLSAFTSFSKNEIPLSFILVVVLYIGREIALSYGLAGAAGETGSLSNIAGGVCGSLFAFLAVPKSARKSGKTSEKSSSKPSGWSKTSKSGKKSSGSGSYEDGGAGESSNNTWSNGYGGYGDQNSYESGYSYGGNSSGGYSYGGNGSNSGNFGDENTVIGSIEL